MKRVRWSRMMLGFLLLLLSAVMLLFFVSKSSKQATKILSPIDRILYRVDTVISWPFQELGRLNDSVMALLKTYEENNSLKNSLRTLEFQKSQFEELKEENQELKDALGLKVEKEQDHPISAEMVYRQSKLWLDYMVINAGQSSGVKEGMLVLTSKGLIGRIDTAYDTSSRVSLLTNEMGDLTIPVKLSYGDKNVYGVLSSYDYEKRTFVVTELNSSESIPEGTSVTTSGLDGETPANVMIGKVISYKSEDGLLNRKIYVAPSADFTNIKFVIVIGK